MCGITGFIDFRGTTEHRVLTEMTNALLHRGPDDFGCEVYREDGCEIGFGHRRLSVIDLTKAGHQPMHAGDYCIILNGEIYNYNEIKLRLIQDGVDFVSESDTEVVLKAFIKWGLDAVKYFIGMFAFVIYDKLRKRVLFCRDRAGVKPLYIYKTDGLFLFASEVKALLKHPRFSREIDDHALHDFIQFGYISGNQSIFKQCSKVPPGHWLEIDLRRRTERLDQYWSVENFFHKPLFTLDERELVDEVDSLVVSSCKYRMVADVPVGVFLSGGYDSALVTAILQQQSSSKIKTFTIGFPDGVDESLSAGKIADYLGTDHTAIDCTHRDAQLIIPDLPYYYDEPFADISAIPSILVSRLARKSVTVALSADGGDELFAGYTWYRNFYRRMNQIDYVPEFCKPYASRVLKRLDEMIPMKEAHVKARLDGLSYVLGASRSSRLAELMFQSRKLPDSFNQELFREVKSRRPEIFSRSYDGMNSNWSSMLSIDYQMNLTDCLLVKVDRATMSTSLEGREPLMDHRLAEFAAQMPMKLKFDGTTHKKVLRTVTHRYIPSSLMDRPKIGFDLPLFDYLREDLSYLLDEYLSPSAIRDSHYFEPKFVLELVKLFKAGKLLYSPVIWRLLIFQMWFKKWAV